MPTLRRIHPLIAVSLSPARLLHRLLAAEAQARSRRALTRLDDHILRDIGLTREEAEAEARRSAWDAPLHWKGLKVDTFRSLIRGKVLEIQPPVPNILCTRSRRSPRRCP